MKDYTPNLMRKSTTGSSRGSKGIECQELGHIVGNSASPSFPTPDICPGFSAIKSGCYIEKLSETHLNYMFLSLAKKAGYTEITPELQATKEKMKQYYAPFMATYGSNLLEMCPVRLKSLGQVLSETSLPVVVGGCFFLLSANSAALEMSGLKLSDFGVSSQTKKFIFDILHPDDAIPFVKRSIECLVGFTNMERIKVRLVLPSGGVCRCIISETTHRNSQGVPLFSSFTIVRIDDL